MAKAPFFEIGAELVLELQWKCINMQYPISMEKRVAIAIWKLTTPKYYQLIATQLGRSTTGASVTQVFDAKEKVLLYQIVKLEMLRRLLMAFAHKAFPNRIGAIRTHVPIICLLFSRAQSLYTERGISPWCSIIMASFQTTLHLSM